MVVLFVLKYSENYIPWKRLLMSFLGIVRLWICIKDSFSENKIWSPILEDRRSTHIFLSLLKDPVHLKCLVSAQHVYLFFELSDIQLIKSLRIHGIYLCYLMHVKFLYVWIKHKELDFSFFFFGLFLKIFYNFFYVTGMSLLYL